MFSPTVAHDWHFPRSVTGVRVLLAWAGERGVPPEALLAGSGLGAGDVAAPERADDEREVTAEQELAVVRALLRHRPAGRSEDGRSEDGRSTRTDADLGDAVGAAYHLGSFGVFGFAMLAGPTLLDAVELATRYIDLSFTFALPAATLEGSVEDGEVRVVVDGAPLPADVRAFLVARDARAIATALGELLPGLDVAVRAEEGHARATVSFAARRLGETLPQGNAATAAACERLCAELVDRRRSRRGLAQQVRVLVRQEVASGAPAATVAARLGLSERTLRRRLAAQGTSYSELLDEVRSGLASVLLAGPLPLDDVALQLGYAEASSLIHAHRRWTGRTPRQPQA
ncbi:helix-turn-helix domain-containing protein [Nocardioides zeae]|uniref:Helix-turn-helix domain-containing protein n=1 Tax=Nocardioides imazamoxiresistens TaxID=3231893 RepID=A0ABU3Q107_9ACTN|nr:helix-turn-helix domain-containing protein [Nocardioides zeae]MDT9595190.1 helix-turn-helix domain-containing protein [Nocardioides zeae]